MNHHKCFILSLLALTTYYIVRVWASYPSALESISAGASFLMLVLVCFLAAKAARAWIVLGAVFFALHIAANLDASVARWALTLLFLCIHIRAAWVARLKN